jgi:glycosyltransferase involved in cell wall biosynthesis
MKGITVAYSGVNQAYQLALAAEELGWLDHFYCSLFAAPGKWGGVMARLLGDDALHNRRVDGLPAAKARENPWPMLRHRLRLSLNLARISEWEQAHIHFDSWAAKLLATSSSRIFVGVETCCAHALKVARENGMVAFVDWPGISTKFLTQRAIEAAHQFSLSTTASVDSSEMSARKQQEMELADVILACSDFHARTLCDQGFPPEKLRVVPLWVDTTFWRPSDRYMASVSGPLRVLYAGKINIRKGVTYLVQAAGACGREVALTLIGNVEDELSPFFKRHGATVKLIPACTKAELRRRLHEHDLLVLPSLGDSFGLVALEAMACGLPVIVSENCGAPVPDTSWRTPAMNADAIARRLALYAENRDLLNEHGEIALNFASQFTPSRYREQIKELFKQVE